MALHANILIQILLILKLTSIDSLYYDGIQSYSIYPRLDLQLCPNSSLSFDFTVSTSNTMNAFFKSNYTFSNQNQNSANQQPRLLIYSEQQIQISTGLNSKKLVNTYFLIKLVNNNRLVVNDYWSLNDITFQLPNDYLTSWFRFVYTRRSTTAEISLYKYEISPRTNIDQIISLKLTPVFTKQIIHTNFLIDDILAASNQKTFTDPTQMTYSQLLVGGVGDDNLTYSYTQLKQLGKFHGYLMNLQYTSYSSLCSSGSTNDNSCSKSGSATQRQYAIFSSSTSKQYKLQQFVDRDSLMIDDICESDTLTHDICPKDCSCLSNNFQAPYFNCDCSDSTNKLNHNQCSMLFKSFALNLDDVNYFGTNQEKFDYPILPSFTKINVQNTGTQFDKLKGLQFKTSASYLNLMPSSDILESDACFWNIDDCVNGFVQHMIMSLDRIDEKKINQKVIIFINGQDSSSKFLAYIYKNRLHFSIYEYDENVEWIVSSPILDKNKYLNRQLKITITWQRDKYFSLHFDGFLIDLINKPLASPLNQDIYLATNSLNKYNYEYGTKTIAANNDLLSLNIKSSHLEKMSQFSHQFSIKYIRRDYYNDLDVQDSKIIVSSPLPSEIIRIDNTQRVMYKIDSPLTGVTTETIELSFRTSQPDGVIFYIRNNPIISYFELVRGQPVVVIDTRYKNVHLRPVTAPLNDNQWHEVKLHRDGQTVSINIDSQYHDSADLGQSNSQILTGGYVYLGLADPNNINLSDKKTFIGEMVRGKVTINNIQQKVVQQPYYWPSIPAITTNQTVNIDTSQISHDGKMINIIINVYGPPGFNVNAGQKTDADTHYIYLDNLPDTRYVSVGSSDREIDFRVGGTRLEGFLIKFQTRQSSGQLVTLINDPRNYIGLEIYDGFVYSSTSLNGATQRFQVSRVRVDDGRIYQINMKQEQQKLLCWLDVDDSYKQSIMYTSPTPIAVNNIRIAGQDGIDYGYSSRFGFVGCIGAVMLNERDVIDYKFVSTERRQSCQNVIQPQQIIQSTTTTPAPAVTQPSTQPSVSLGYISFSGSVDILVYNYFYDHEKPLFEDISFIFRTVVSHGILFSAHNDDSNNPSLIGAYIKDGIVHVVYLNSSFTQDLYFTHTTVDDGNLYRLNIRRNSNGYGFIQLQSYESVKALDFYTQSGKIKFTKVLVGGTDEWARVKFFGTRPDFVGCIIDLFQINGNSVIKPADISKDRYNCHVERRRPVVVTTVRPTSTRKPQCLPDGYPISFSSTDDALTYQHETQICEHIHIPFRTRDPRGIIYSHSSDDGRFFIIVYLRRGFLNIIVRDNNAERELELESRRVDDGEQHKLDIHCFSNYLIAYIDQNRKVSSNRVELSSPIYLSSYTLGYFNEEILSSKYSTLDNFRGCLEQVLFNKECLIYEILADRNRLTCSVQPLPIQDMETTTVQNIKKTNCVNTCYNSDSECVIELSSKGYLVYQAKDTGAQPSNKDSIGFTFRVLDLHEEVQELITIFNSDQSTRLYLSGGQIMLEIRGQRISNIAQSFNYNDGKWHRLVLEKNNQELMVKIDDATSAIPVPFPFDLYGDGRIFFGATVGKDSNNFHGLYKDVYVRYSNVEYDIVASTKDNRIPGITCEGSVIVKSYEESPKLKCVSEPVVDSMNECSTDGVCYASLWRNSSGVIERSMRCFNRDQLQPLENPLLCRSQDPTRYVIQCCNTQYCNKDLQLTLKDIDKNDERSIWRFRGPNSGKIEFNPYLTPVDRAELNFNFNTSKLEGNLFCTKDDTTVLKAELKDSGLFVTLTDLRSKRVLKTVSCKPNTGTQFNDNKLHKLSLSKQSRSQIFLTCDDGQTQSLQYDVDIPFINTKNGVVFGLDCANDKGKRFNGDLSQIVYVHDTQSFSFDDLQYSEDPRLTYEAYVEFRPKFITETFSDPKPIHFRSKSSSARINKWDDSKIGRITFEFKQEITGENGFLFSTESGGNYFAIVINDGYLESILSPHRVHNADSSNSVQFYDRFQRLFPHPRTKINDGNWHKLEFMMLGDSVGSFVLDDDFSTKIRFPFNYWSEDSAIVFGNNLDIQRDLKRTDLAGSFRGCIRNIVINNRLIDWLNRGNLYNIEVGCYHYKLAPNQIFFLQLDNEDLESSSNIQFNGDGCIRYHSKKTSSNDKETIEFLFKTNGDRMVLLDSVGSEFIIHIQGPGLTIRNKDDTVSLTIIERGIEFNDGNLHKLKLDRIDNKIEIELDNKYKKEYILNKRTQLGPFNLGCSRDKKLKIRLTELKDFRGNLLNVFYSSGSQTKVDLVDTLNDGDSSALTDGNVLWNNGAIRTISSGNRANDDSVMFNEATSFLKLEKIDFDQNSNITFSFKTNENDALLAFISPSDRQLNLLVSNYMAVELVDGSVSLLINFGNQYKRLSCSPNQAPAATRLNDNKWHSIQIRRERLGTADSTTPTSSITLGCDNNYARIKVSEQQKHPLTIISVGNISVNLPNELWLSKNSKFVGCIRDFKLNSKSIDIYKETTSESRVTLSKGCKDNLIHSLKSGCDALSFSGSKGELGASTLSFNGSQGISFSLHDVVRSSSEDVALRFKTRVRNGILFGLKKSENEPSFIISLEDGRIKIVYDRDINDKVIYIGEPNLFNNNKWHTVHVKRYGQNVFGEVFDQEKNRYHVVDDLDSGFLNVVYRHVEIGNINSVSLLQEHPSFIGWIQNVKLNCDELLNYYLNERLPNRPGVITGIAGVGDNSLLLHHQLTFTGSCPISLPRVMSNEQRFNIHLFFKSGQSGVIFFRRGKETRFIALELSDGILRFVFELGGGLKVLESDPMASLSDRKWHEVTIKRFDRQKFAMKIDDFKELLIDIGSNSPPLHELETSFVIGGLLSDQQKIVKDNLGNKGFIGCIASLEINNDPANLYSNMLSLCPSVQHGCIDSVCLPNPCSNNGKCSLLNNQVSCECAMTSYSGQFCRDDSLFHFFGGQSKKCGMIRYRIEPPIPDQLQDTLAFGFTTTSLDAKLVRIESVDEKQFIEVRLKEGVIVLEMKINNIVDSKNYLPSTGERFNDNKYHVVQLIRNKNDVKFRIDNFDQLEFSLQGDESIFHNQYFVYVGSVQDERGDLLQCYYGIISGMVLNGHYVLDKGTILGDVIISGSKYVTTEIEGSRSISLLPDGFCPLGYLKTNNLCVFSGCPLYSDFLGDYNCRCYYSYYHISNGINECRKMNETSSKSSILGSSAKLIPARNKVAETPIGLILGIISGIALALLAAAIGARKCADGLCVPAPPKTKSARTIGGAVSQVITGTATTTNDSYAASSLTKREEIPLIQKTEHYAQSDEYYKDTLDFGYRDRYALVPPPPPAPIFTQINETTEMFEQTLGGVTTTIIPTVTTTTYNTTGSTSQSAHHSSHRNLAMDSLFYTQNNSSDYELSNVTCVTMTPNGKYAIIGQSNGTPQIWDTISGQLIRSMTGVCTNCSNLTLACNGSFLVGLASDGSLDGHTQSLQIWEVQTGKSIQMSHQIKCCVFSLSADSNSIFMAGNQRFGRGISVGILDLVTNELTKEIKSDPTISFGDNPDSIVVTPDERHAIVGCKSISGTNFVVFDITKSTEIAQTRSIALDADPKCIQVLNNNEVVTGTRGGHLIQWNIHTCEPTISFDDPGYMQAHRSSINQISLSSDLEYLVSASSDFTAKVWNTKTKSLVCILSGHRGEVLCASISNNDLVVTGSTDQTVGLWRLHNGNPISTMTVGMSVIEVNMAKHNKTIIAIGEKEGEQQRETQLLMLKVINVQR